MHRPTLALITLLITTAFASADEPVDYLRDVKPILEKRCYTCHGALRRRAGLRLDTADLIRKGSDGGAVIAPGQSDDSLLIYAVTGELGFRMPPEGDPLEPEQIEILKAWIDAGAEAPPEAPPADPRTHWAFQPPMRPEVPSVDRRDWVRNPIDAFLAAEHEARGLVPGPPAEKPVLLRRVYLDLVGLPPTREELHAFLADTAPGAYERVVDRLLASPRYGERWGRHWMDIWRYSDWSGYRDEIRNSQRHIWHWRDWIVESLNQDKGYDRMLLEMLAGDEVAPADPDTLRATGFLARNWYKFNRNVWLEQTVEHTAKGFLGLTLHCARCHDHKYDPIANEEYYAFRAFFEPHQVRTDRLPGEPDVMKAGLPHVYDADLDAVTYVFARGDERHPIKDKAIAPALPEFLGGRLAIAPVSLPAEAYYPGLKPYIRREELAAAKSSVADAEAACKDAEQSLSEARSRVAELPPATNRAASGNTTSADALASLANARSEARAAEARLVEIAERAVALAERKRETANARLSSLRARIAADDAKFGDASQADADRLAQEAAHAERQAAVAKANEALLVAEQKLAAVRQKSDAETDEGKTAIADAEKAVADTQKAFKQAEAAVAESTGAYTPLTEVFPATSTGRRLALARWITDAKNPLTARVAVNHVWMRHFGAPLVSTVFDFGLRGSKPTHPQLLDWLAVEFMENGWSLKHLHRLMVTSNAYRMRSSAGEATSNSDTDPENHYLWRMNPRRMEAEIVRDSVLCVAGTLDDAMGGPDLPYESGLRSHRRSLYYQHAYEKQMTLLKLFDVANVNECYRRKPSIVPQQALALANSSLALDQSRILARRLTEECASGDKGKQAAHATDAQFVTAAFEQVLGRPETPDERAACLEFLKAQADRLRDPDALTPVSTGEKSDVAPSVAPNQRTRENLVHVLLNHNDFVTIR